MTYLTYQDLAERWGQTPGTLRQWRRRGKLPDPDLVLGRSPAWKESTIQRLEDKNGQPGTRSE